ncbi:MAG: hypothetical protein ACK4MY_14840, partial [Brevundimonas sp.]
MGLREGDVGYAPHDRYPAGVGERWNYATIDASPEQVEAAIREAIQRGGGAPPERPPPPRPREGHAQGPGRFGVVAAGQDP